MESGEQSSNILTSKAQEKTTFLGKIAEFFHKHNATPLESSGSKLNRRDFLKLSGAAIASGALLPKIAKAEGFIKQVSESKLVTEEASTRNETSLLEWREISEQEEEMWKLVGKKNPLAEQYEAETIKLTEFAIPVRPSSAQSEIESKASPHLISHLQQLVENGKKEGVDLWVGSAFRNFQTQQDLYNQNPTSRVPGGCSQHQTGYAIDFVCPNTQFKVDTSFSDTEESKFLEKEAAKYGFIKTYEENNTYDDVPSESWHYYYVGVPMARTYQALRNSGWEGNIFDIFGLIENNGKKVPISMVDGEEYIVISPADLVEK